jgi:hypothetical protein
MTQPTIGQVHYMLLAQIAFSVGGMIFSGAMLIRGEDASIYLPVMTGILGAWMPSPLQQFNKKNQQITGPTPPQQQLATLSPV